MSKAGKILDWVKDNKGWVVAGGIAVIGIVAMAIDNHKYYPIPREIAGKAFAMGVPLREGGYSREELEAYLDEHPDEEKVIYRKSEDNFDIME